MGEGAGGTPTAFLEVRIGTFMFLNNRRGEGSASVTSTIHILGGN